ncbi:SpoIIIAH-like family protein [Paenibacillus pasadenensis]|uniref:SpoIIIAH-like family protein n=1 Tax=Paenibacillus pasadenensis TaxID=217090 RepID=UPI00203D667D|nr:SpoIIIAH-like family protein [Paenibacillus pasadenensis]MCM3747297.1 SpoIIIAH-like family protein [Paenibacillus pasadenensis]
MNSKRQTIWLVSMLSLMVVLSAYYLLTDSPGSKGITDAQTQAGAQEVVEGIDVDQVTGGEAVNEEAAAEAAETDGASAAGGQDSKDGAQQGTEGSGTQDSGTQAEEKNADKETSAETGLSPEDQAVLEQFETGGAASQFQDMGTRSQERVNAEYEKLMSEISSASAEESTKAIAELDSFELRQGKLTDLRDQLEKDFKNVVIDENGESVKVVVQSQKLERSQAAAIITKVSTSLNISAGDVLVQYLP